MFLDKLFSRKVYTWATTKPFIPPVASGQVIKVYDGDTITIGTTLIFKNSMLKTIKEDYRFSIRLTGIVCPELQSRDPDEKMVATYVKYQLIDKIVGKYIKLKNVETEKYGRILAEVYLGKENINNWLIENKFAVEYNGGTKNTPKNWLNYLGLDRNIIQQYIENHENDDN